MDNNSPQIQNIHQSNMQQISMQENINNPVNELRKKIKQALLISILVVLILSGVIAAVLVAISVQSAIILRTFTFIFNLIFHLAIALVLIWDEKNNILNSRFQVLMMTIFFSVIVNFISSSIPIFWDGYEYSNSVFISLVTTIGVVSIFEYIYRILGRTVYLDVALYSTFFFVLLSYFLVLPLYFEPDIILSAFDRYGNILLSMLILMSVSVFSSIVLYRIYLNKNLEAQKEKIMTSDMQLLLSIVIIIFVVVFCYSFGLFVS
ncbi:MAG: hypothetical protein N3A71_01100 [Candidatus Dojkabacteria bacterium]|nr:hypothetical protein [Candidatus Dojkabacteria bacterium]